MHRASWDLVKRAFELAVEKTGVERTAVLAEACGGDPDVLARVGALLNADDAARDLPS